MSKKEQADFLFTVLKHTTLNLNVRHLSAACDLSLGATQMRMTRLRRKLEKGNAEDADLEFLEKVWEFSGGKTDVKGLASELGLKTGAVSMRLSRLRKRIASAGRKRGACRNNERVAIAMQEAEKKVKTEHELYRRPVRVKFTSGVLRGL
jgi:hypothetical protein